MRWWFKQQLFVQIFICILIGIGFGFLLGEKVTIIQPIGDIFIRLLKMLIVPLTFFTLVNGITKMESLRSLRSVGGMTIIYYMLTTCFATIIGISTAVLINPGKNAVGLLDSDAIVETQNFNLLENIVNWVPVNPIEAMASANMLQIILFSMIVGIGLLALQERTANLRNLIQEGSDLMIKITEFVMKLAPYGILALIANMVGTLGTDMLSEVGRFILTDTIAVVCILIFIYPTLIKILTGLSPFRFYHNIAPAMLVAAGTTSSSATLPVSMGIAAKKLGAPERIFGFTLPLGATINMDGMAAAIGVIAVFSANLYNISMTPVLLFQFIFLGLALSIGTAGIKGGGIIMSTVLLQTLNLPLTLIPILAAVWPIIDISHTTCNVTGDLTGTTIIGDKLGLLDRELFET